MNSTEKDKDGHITIALAVFNGEDTIEKAVRSLLEQSYDKLDLFVVDDASTDGTFEILQSILPEDERLHVIRMDNNEGTYSAKNLVLRKFCHSEFFAHQDADDFSWKERFKAQVEFLGNHPEIAACGTGIDEFYLSEAAGPSTKSDFPAVFNKEDGYFHRKNLYDPVLPKGTCFNYSIDNLAHIKTVMNGSVMFRADILKQLGGFDGRTRLAGDTELYWRLLAFHPIGNLQEVLYSRYFHPRSLTKSKTYGFGSALRTSYMVKIKAGLTELQAFYDRGETEEVIKRTTQDMHVGDSPYKVYHGGSRSILSHSSINTG